MKHYLEITNLFASFNFESTNFSSMLDTKMLNLEINQSWFGGMQCNACFRQENPTSLHDTALSLPPTPTLILRCAVRMATSFPEYPIFPENAGGRGFLIPTTGY